MAAVLKLNWGTVNVDLLTGTALNVMTWTPKLATPTPGRIPEPVTESLTVRAAGSTHDTLAANLQPLHDMQRRANEYVEDQGQGTPVWLHAKMANETGERRALVRRIDGEFVTPWYGPMANANPTIMLSMALEREPFWEATSETAEATLGTAINTIGGTAHYSGVAGDVAARLNTHLYSLTTPTGNDPSIDTVWMGVRSADRHANPGNLVTKWGRLEASLGTDVGQVADADASGGTVAIVTFASESGWGNRMESAYYGTAGANTSDQDGRFLLLLRARVNSGTSEVRLRTAWQVSGVLGQPQQAIQVTNTTYKYHEAGVVTVPPQRLDGGRDWANFVMRYDARRISAGGSLYLDATVMIPIDEAFIKLEDGAIIKVGADERPMYAIRRPEGVLDAYAYTGDEVIAVPPITEHHWYLPPGSGMVVLAAERSGSQVSTDQLALKTSYASRWLSLRGGD